MSRLGKQAIQIPEGVKVCLDGSKLKVSGPKGILEKETYNRITIKINDNMLSVEPIAGENSNAFWGLYRSLLANMVLGVSTGFSKSLEVQGTGYRASVSDKTLNLVVGFSHPVNINPPPGIVFEVDKAGVIHIHGIDKELVGQVSAKVRNIRPAEPYQGKGIRYLGELIKTKVGKSAGKK